MPSSITHHLEQVEDQSPRAKLDDVILSLDSAINVMGHDAIISGRQRGASVLRAFNEAWYWASISNIEQKHD